MPYLNQVEFAYGEIDPRLINKSNLSFYVQSASKIENGLVTNLTNIKRRFGLEYIRTISASSNQYHMEEFIYNIDSIYLLVFTNLQLEIYKDDVLVATIITVWTGAQLADNKINTSMTNNEMLIASGDFAPYRLTRGGDDSTWSLVLETFKNFPTYDFKKNYDSFSFSLSVVTVGEGATLTCSDDIFDSTYVGGYFSSVGNENLTDSDIGSARITAFVDAKNVTVEITSQFDSSLSSGTVSGKNCIVAQPAWSDAKGWPRSLAFYEGRVWYGGTISLPNIIFGSVVNSYDNFDVATAQDSDAVIAALDGSNGEPVGDIKYIVGDKSLQIFCERSEHAIPQETGNAITPDTVSVRRQSSEGISNVSPVLFDNTTMFVRRKGKAIIAYNYQGDGASYTSENLSKAASHLLNGPIDIGVLKSLSDDDESYLFIINTDGTMATLQADSDQNVKAFTGLVTDGSFKRVVSVDTDIYFIVERVVNGTTLQYLEKLNFDVYSDSVKTYTSIPPTTTLTGLSHLEAKEVAVIGDGYVLENRTVSSGQITIERSVTNAVVGIPFTVTINPHPPMIFGSNGSQYYTKKRIIRVFLHFFETLGVFVEGQLVPYLTLDESAFEPPVPQTGIFEFDLLSDWDPLQEISITQDGPLPLTILGIGYQITADASEGE